MSIDRRSFRIGILAGVFLLSGVLVVFCQRRFRLDEPGRKRPGRQSGAVSEVERIPGGGQGHHAGGGEYFHHACREEPGRSGLAVHG